MKEKSCINSPFSSISGLPGAVWHIFRPCDTAGLREYLIKIDKLTTNPSSGSASTAGGDVIHDQRMFLSQGQLEELKVETGIKPYTVLQFPGDAILIPAGSVHQVSPFQILSFYSYNQLSFQRKGRSLNIYL